MIDKVQAGELREVERKERWNQARSQLRDLKFGVARSRRCAGPMVDFRALAFAGHEACHAVVRYLLNLPFRIISIVPGLEPPAPLGLPQDSPEGIPGELVSLLGPAAFMDLDYEEVRTVTPSDWNAACTLAGAAACGGGSERVLRRGYEMARRLLALPGSRDAIAMLAGELLKHSRLDYPQAIALLDSAFIESLAAPATVH